MRSLSLIARTGPRFRDFAPYVPAIDDAGTVAFQAALTAGGSGVFTGDGGPVTTVADSASGTFREVISHPDIANDGSLCFYALSRPERRRARDGKDAQRLVLVRDGQEIGIADSGAASSAPSFTGIGPLGPTMNHDRAVAFRADLAPGVSGVFVTDGRPAGVIEARRSGATVIATAESDGHFSGFQGLPVINRQGTVAFRADLGDGGQGIYTWSQGTVTPVVTTTSATGPAAPDDDRPRFRQLGRFPTINDAGTLAFAGVLESGLPGIFTVGQGRPTPVTAIDSAGPFESFRGVLLDDAGAMVFYATPRGGELAIYRGPDPVAAPVLAIGEPLDPPLDARWHDTPVRAFVLNPVSINGVGQLAIRVEFADGEQAIIRADPA